MKYTAPILIKAQIGHRTKADGPVAILGPFIPFHRGTPTPRSLLGFG